MWGDVEPWQWAVQHLWELVRLNESYTDHKNGKQFVPLWKVDWLAFGEARANGHQAWNYEDGDTLMTFMRLIAAEMSTPVGR